MAARGAAILASTHYGELKAFAYEAPGFENAAMEFDPKTLRPTYRLIMGTPGASHALRIAERYGIPPEVVEQAREGLGEGAMDVARMLERLEQAQRQARIAQSEADRRTAELKRLEAQAERSLRDADETRRSAGSRASDAMEAALREIRLEASRIFDELKKAPADPRALEKARRELRELQEVGGEFAGDLRPKERRSTAPPPTLKKGDTVRIAGYTQVGTLVDDPRAGSVAVQMGPLRMTVPVSSLETAQAPRPAPVKARPNVRLQKAMTASTETDLRHLRAEDAVRDLEKFVDDAVLAGLDSVRIVHGKGEGVLRRVTREVLSRHPHIVSYRDGEPGEGGQGVTVAVIE
jgi:DNA mismatch repair protein MutS2